MNHKRRKRILLLAGILILTGIIVLMLYHFNILPHRYYDNAYFVHNYAIIIFKSKEENYAAN